MDEEINTRKARDIVQAWMNQHDVTAAELARIANLDRAVISRFLQYARPMQVRTAVHIYAAVQARMDNATRSDLRIALGLQEIMQLLTQTDPLTLDEASHYPSGQARAVAQIAHAIHLSQHGLYGKAADIFEQSMQALRTPHGSQSLTMYCLCERIRCLIELGCFNAARDGIVQATALFEPVCGAEGSLRLLALRLRMAYEMGDLANAHFLYRKLLFEADLHRNSAFRSTALHYGAMLRLALAMRTTERQHRELHVTKAMRLFRMHDDYENRHASDAITAGMRALRWAEIHRIRRAEDDARAARRNARRLLRHTPAIHVVYAEMAKVALDRDQLDRSRTLAVEARELAVDADQALGVVHASYILAVADVMEEKFSSALDHAVVAAALTPFWCFEDGTSTLEYMRQIVRSLVSSIDTMQRSQLELSLRDRIVERRGPFAVLDSLRAGRERARLHVYGRVSV